MDRSGAGDMAPVSFITSGQLFFLASKRSSTCFSMYNCFLICFVCSLTSIWMAKSVVPERTIRFLTCLKVSLDWGPLVLQHKSTKLRERNHLRFDLRLFPIITEPCWK